MTVVVMMVITVIIISYRQLLHYNNYNNLCCYERSSRLIRNLSNCEREAWKKFRLQRDSNPWPLRYRCSALPTELWSHNCWEEAAPNSCGFRPAPNSCGFIAQLVEHCTGIAEVTDLNPAEAWIFFRLLFRNCLNCVSTAKIFHNVITHNRGTNPVTTIIYVYKRRVLEITTRMLGLVFNC